MKLKCPACLKNIAGAFFVLAVLMLSIEAGLRLNRGGSGPQDIDVLHDSPLLVISCQTHHSLKPLVQAEVMNRDAGRPVLVQTNSIGVRGGEVVVPKPAGMYRVLVLGDESTFAPETPEEATFCAHLQRELQQRTRKPVEVVNAGVPGYCPLLSYLQMKHHLLGLQPDLVVLNVDMTDVADDHRCRRYLQVDDDGRPLLCRHPRCEADPAANRPRNDGSALLTWFKRQIGRAGTSGGSQDETDDISSPLGRYAWLRDDGPDWSVHANLAFEPIAALQELSRQVGARFVVAVVPAPWQIAAEASNTRDVRAAAGVPQDAVFQNRRPFELLGGFLRKHRIVLADPVADFRRSQRPDSLYLQHAPRFSPAGHELFGRILVDAVADELAEPDSVPSGRVVPAVSASHRRNDRRRPSDLRVRPRR